MTTTQSTKLDKQIAIGILMLRGWSRRKAEDTVTELMRRGAIRDDQTRIAVYCEDGTFDIVDLAKVPA